MGTALVVTSGKGGVGKTTTSANIGTALALQGKRVVLLDLDIGLRNLDVVLGLSNRIIYDIVDVTTGRAKLHQALIKDKRFDDLLYVLPAAQNAEKDALEPEQVKEIVAQLRDEFDFILLDSPAGIEQGFRNAVEGADGAIVVTTPEISAVSDADRVVGLLEQRDMVYPPRLVINRIRLKMMDDGRAMDVDEITQHLGIDLLGIIIDDDDVIATSNKGDTVVMDPDNLASKGYRNIARRLMGESVPLMKLEQKKVGFWQRLFHRG
ncbi:septum site-determining protein MinD [Lacticaseibacillus manihotivorans]|uniref:Septum site-determining protein MinD n=2 Tax=Lacticaseibacillus manihotivorans TaxID=88233 RepID=A0A0R1QNU7_9LACO|nr:septum site-determining protein MinD [Lacticaseibacillus manihotivorans]KRL43861.1 septum formation-inhibiting ATPase, ATPase ParA-type [Lacticaseibacillus manihotivorans DSM 13343 = JCM 12514]QFQ91089.1 septum site-determining protein MinD [Lacticaseibacillus manihotivorans]